MGSAFTIRLPFVRNRSTDMRGAAETGRFAIYIRNPRFLGTVTRDRLTACNRYSYRLQCAPTQGVVAPLWVGRICLKCIV